jgi:translocator assembly and maintenance protein 41
MVYMSGGGLRRWLGEMLTTSFPATRMAFAYGSGVFSQQTAAEVRAATNGNQEAPMIDLVLTVDNPTMWHKENIQRNRNHYSAAAYVGSSFIAKTQETAAAVWYNTLVPIPEPWGDGRQLMKYGVISSHALEKDLKTWSSFYISGRMQKPIAWIEGYKMSDSNKKDFIGYGVDGKIAEKVDLVKAGQTNLKGALAAALLQLPNTFTEGQLYETITGLSYAGDFRMAIAENPDKITNIVKNGGSPARFRKLYEPFLSEMKSVTCLDNRIDNSDILNVRFEQDVTKNARINMLNELPLEIQKRMTLNLNQNGNNDGDADALISEKLANAMRLTLSTLVGQTALKQTMKGLASAGVTKSAVYSMSKIRKKIKGGKNKI